jgi:hypothetical protein
MSNIYKTVFRNESNNLSGTDVFTSMYTKGIWASGLGNLKTFHTSSAQSATNRQYYTQVWMTASVNSSENDMFTIAYGNIIGRGSKFVAGAVDNYGQLDDTPSRAIYSQYSLTCLEEPTNGGFTQFYNKMAKNSHLASLGWVTASGTVDTFGSRIDHFYAISFNRDKYGDKLDPGNFEVNITELNGTSYPNSLFTGSNVQLAASPGLITLIDDSADNLEIYEYSQKPSTVRNLVSGSLEAGIYSDNGELHYYGLVYPEYGVIIIDADKLDASSSFNTVIGSNINGENPDKLFTAISGSVTEFDKGFVARGVDVKNQQSVFIRVNSTEMNYSNNPTYADSNSRDGTLLNPSFVYNPYVYITTIGLYNDNNDLLAVAKLSQPLQKSFNSEVSITVKLEY